MYTDARTNACTCTHVKFTCGASDLCEKLEKQKAGRLIQMSVVQTASRQVNSMINTGTLKRQQLRPQRHLPLLDASVSSAKSNILSTDKSSIEPKIDKTLHVTYYKWHLVLRLSENLLPGCIITCCTVKLMKRDTSSMANAC